LGFVPVVILVMINGFCAAELVWSSCARHALPNGSRNGIPAPKPSRRPSQTPIALSRRPVGITLASLGLGWIGEPALSHLIEPLLAWLPGEIAGVAAHIAAASIIAFVLITGLHVIIGELMPKSIALQRPERTALLVARPTLLVVSLRPFIWALNAPASAARAGLQPQQDKHCIGRREDAGDASEEGGVLEKQERYAACRVRAYDLTAHQVMVPRTEMVTLNETPWRKS
jgi:CBS domain containing-hemolysin-like protein